MGCDRRDMGLVQVWRALPERTFWKPCHNLRLLKPVSLLTVRVQRGNPACCSYQPEAALLSKSHTVWSTACAQNHCPLQSTDVWVRSPILFIDSCQSSLLVVSVNKFGCCHSTHQLKIKPTHCPSPLSHPHFENSVTVWVRMFRLLNPMAWHV